jgi:hypothetical protein
VPLARYFFFIGSLLLAALFLADRYLPDSSQTFSREARVDKSIIRIKSAHKWPEKIVFDTSLPTIVPPPPPLLAQAPVSSQPREAFARLDVSSPQGLRNPSPVKVKRKVAKLAEPTKMAAYPVPQEALPAGW